MKTIIIPDVDVVREDWADELAGRLANDEQMSALWYAVEKIHEAAKSGEPEAASTVAANYAIVRDLLCVSAAGRLAPWPDEFWEGSLGRLLFYAHLVTHGEDLLLAKEAADILGISTPRLGHLQQLGLIDFVVDADADHPRQHKRRVTRAMVDEYLAERASPRAVSRKVKHGREVPVM